MICSDNVENMFTSDPQFCLWQPETSWTTPHFMWCEYHKKKKKHPHNIFEYDSYSRVQLQSTTDAIESYEQCDCAQHSMRCIFLRLSCWSYSSGVVQHCRLWPFITFIHLVFVLLRPCGASHVFPHWYLFNSLPVLVTYFLPGCISGVLGFLAKQKPLSGEKLFWYV